VGEGGEGGGGGGGGGSQFSRFRISLIPRLFGYEASSGSVHHPVIKF